MFHAPLILKSLPRLLLLCLIWMWSTVTGQAQYTALREPVRTVWAANKQLAAQQFQLAQAQAALQEARALYGPTIGFGLQYTLAAGGRTIEFPIGDLLNPVYGTLNQLTQTNRFPSLENQSIQFFPNNFYDARFRITQPIYVADLRFNKEARTEMINLRQLEIRAFKRQLAREFSHTWYQYQQAGAALRIFDETLQLLNTARRTTESLVRNGVALPSALQRLDAEVAAVQAQRTGVRSQQTNAKAYLEHLLQQPLETGKITDTLVTGLPVLPQDTLPDGREETDQLRLAQRLADIQKSREKAFYQPKLGAQLDLGSQDFDFGWQPYALFGINLEVPLFDNRQHKYRQEQTDLALKSSQEQLAQAERQLLLQCQTMLTSLKASISQAQTYAPRLEASRRLYRDVLRRYQEGSANYLELIDAGTQITTTGLQYEVARFQAWSQLAELEFATAAWPID